jgi:lysophospholipase L1-like esterase
VSVEFTVLHTRSQPVAGVPLAPDRRHRWRRHVAVGDSLSEGLGDPLPDRGVRGWATLFAEHLREVAPELEFTNLAVRGHRTRDAIRRQLPAALELRPDLVTVFIGGNDVLLSTRLDRARFSDDPDWLVAPACAARRHSRAVHAARPRCLQPAAAAISRSTSSPR